MTAMPEWLEKEKLVLSWPTPMVFKMNEKDKAFNDGLDLGFQKCYELMKEKLDFEKGNAQQSAAMVEQLCYELQIEKERQKLKPIEEAPESMSILVSIPEVSHMFEAYFDKGRWHCMDGTNGHMTTLVSKPTHWLPLPETQGGEG